ncbi:glycoside hydrolase family 2 TIM barrel-domain containing protein [Aquibacillus albus]|uniref:Beta-galactosidase n=1 Tax=Aquibacillus albus TaxID=1168171 RepID=A0ABS2N147_9BACI|nr:glycoside hydrolase family 2 TIM barrel-domain containing protein [Aquibacillus albus]MBM7571865.1 beta-galactosidase [Aquibacillus albus]
MGNFSRLRESFDFNWKFTKGDPANAEAKHFDDGNWRKLTVPHDWSIEGPFSKNHKAGGDGGYLPTGIGWYRKHFHIKGKTNLEKVFIEFDGVYCNSEVWINGNYLGKRHSGYSGFQYDITSYLEEENVIAVRVDNSQQPSSRWYTGSGIYRHTWLVYTNKVYVPFNGTYITTPEVSAESAIIHAKTNVVNQENQSQNVMLHTTLFNSENKEVGEVKTDCVIDTGDTFECSQKLEIANPSLWSVENPYLYKLKTKILIDNKIVDKVVTPIGIRKIHFDSEKGFYLNDQQVKINGVCLHHDAGAVGAAVPERVLERRLEKLKEMGCNAIRMSHNIPSPEMLDLCDQMGFLVMDEPFDEWMIYKSKAIADGRKLKEDEHFGYFQYFEEDYEKDLTFMLHRDRNHPSVIMWSVGNEIPEQKVLDGHKILKKLVDICHQEDPTRPVTVACDQIKAEPEEARQEFLELLDVVGYNYVDRWRTRTETYYTEDKMENPHWKVIGSENRSIQSVRGEYVLDNQSSSWWRGPYHTNMIRVEQLWKFTKMNDYVAGDFMWTGIDYLGESRWPKKNSSCAPIDLCGFPKDAFYFYQSQWTTEDVLHVFPHWNWEGMEGKVIPVICYTNCDSVELFVNGKSFGEKSYEFPLQGMSEKYGHYEKPFQYPTTADLHLSWDVPYEPGTIKAVGKKNNQVVRSETITTTGSPHQIRLTADRSKLIADQRDVSHITIEILDENGRVVPTADNEILLTVEGEGTLIGLDNGNPKSHEDFKSNRRKAFNGLALVIIQSTLNAGKVKVTATAKGLETASILLDTEQLYD